MMYCECVTATQLMCNYSKCAYQLMCTVEPYTSQIWTLFLLSQLSTLELRTPLKSGQLFGSCPQ